jgi:hypothetical protein
VSLGYQRSDSGLVLPITGADEASVITELKKIDPDLILFVPGMEISGEPAVNRWGWRVYRKRGGDQPPEFVCAWMDKWGNLHNELSHGLVDEVRRLDKNTRGRQLDEVVREELRRQEFERDQEARGEGIADNWVRKHGTPVLPRSQSLRMSRDKRRAQGEKV